MNYYELLGVTKKSTQSDIKKAFRKLSKEMHPDVNPDPEIADQFKSIIEAYETLSDPEKKEHYDQYGYSKPKTNLEAQIVGFFTNHILPLIMDQCSESFLDSEDLVVAFKEIIQEQIDLQKRDLNAGNKKIAKLDLILSRLSCTEQNNIILESWLLQKDQLQLQVNNCERDIKFLEIVLIRAKEFTYKFK